MPRGIGKRRPFDIAGTNRCCFFDAPIGKPSNAPCEAWFAVPKHLKSIASVGFPLGNELARQVARRQVAKLELMRDHTQVSTIFGSSLS